MGICGSKPKGCVGGGRLRLAKKKNQRRRRGVRRRVSSRKFDCSTASDRSYSNPTFQATGSLDAAWFDSTSVLDSECDDEFYSIRDDVMSLNGSEFGLRMNVSSPKHLMKDHADNTILILAPDQQNKQRELKPDEVSSVCEGDNVSRGVEKIADFDHCGLLPNTCLPCLNTSTSSSVDKRRPLSPGQPSLRRKPLSKLSFKSREGQADPTLLSPKSLLRRPLAGTSVPYSPLEKKMANSWSPIDPCTFKVRAKNFFKDKKKDFAPNRAAFYPFGVDIFLSPRKIDHVARFVELSAMTTSGEVPSILVVNVQVPLYSATLFQSESDGEGMSSIMYFKLSENYSKELPSIFRENLTRLINDEVERIKGFPLDSIAPFRERLKILGRVTNIEDLHLSAAEKKLMSAYNEKPVLSRPQHEFYLGENYMEIDLDMHRFSYISRKGFETFVDRVKLCILDFGLTIQGNKAEDLPENMLCCVRFKEIDYTNYNQ